MAWAITFPILSPRSIWRCWPCTEGLFTDPCYTGKIFHGFVDLVRSGKIPEGENAIFLHSGGTPAIWSKEHLDAAQEIFYGGDGLFVHKA